MFETPVRYNIDHGYEYEDKNGSGDQGRDYPVCLDCPGVFFFNRTG